MDLSSQKGPATKSIQSNVPFIRLLIESIESIEELDSRERRIEITHSLNTDHNRDNLIPISISIDPYYIETERVTYREDIEIIEIYRDREQGSPQALRDPREIP